MRHKSLQDFGIPLTATCPVHSNLPSVWALEDPRDGRIKPKLRRVMGKTVLSVMIPLFGSRISNIRIK